MFTEMGIQGAKVEDKECVIMMLRARVRATRSAKSL